MKKVWLEVVFFGMDHFGDGCPLKLVEAPPDGLKPVPSEIPHDEIDKVALSGRHVLLRQRAQFLEILGIHVLTKCNPERGNPFVGVVSHTVLDNLLFPE
jgi:hypothetical protein